MMTSTFMYLARILFVNFNFKEISFFFFISNRKIGLIPVDDIANSVAKTFIPTFQGEMKKSLNEELNKVLADVMLMEKIQLESNAAIM